MKVICTGPSVFPTSQYVTHLSPWSSISEVKDENLLLCCTQNESDDCDRLFCVLVMQLLDFQERSIQINQVEVQLDDIIDYEVLDS